MHLEVLFLTDNSFKRGRFDDQRAKERYIRLMPERGLVVKRFGDFTAVETMNFTIDEGEFIAIMGHQV